MKIIFLGVGEACDENIANNSHIIKSDSKLLLDCGYSVPPSLWKYNSDPNFLDAIYITHAHADHYFGIPPLLIRMWGDKRTKPLTIICHKSITKNIDNLIELGYEGFRKEFPFKINVIGIEEEEKFKFNELTIEIAQTVHYIKNYAVKVSNENNSVCYSGDGELTKKSKELYDNSDLLIHDSFLFEGKVDGHATIKELYDEFDNLNIKCLALTHINTEIRKNNLQQIKEFCKDKNIIIPECFDEYVIK